jgi:hypothetical protein
MRDVFGLGIDLPDLLPKPKLSGTTIRSSPTPLRVSPGVTPEFRHRKRLQDTAHRPRTILNQADRLDARP